MKLKDLIPYLKSNEKVQELYDKEQLDFGSEAIVVYLKHELNIHSEVQFFEIEETDNALDYQEHGISYIQLFSLDDMYDMLKSDQAFLALSDENVARELITRRINQLKN